jgi:hypothetical protein
MATDRSCRRRRRAIAVDEDHEPRPPAGRVCSSPMDAALLVPDPRVSARASSKAAFHRAGGADPQPGRRGQRRGRSRRSPAVERCRRRFSSLASSRSSLSPTSRNIRSTTAPRPTVISAMASTSPINPPTRAAQIEPATTSAAADPNARTRGRGATVPRYRFDQPPSRSQSPGTRVPLRAPRTRRQCGRLEAEQY